MPKCPNCESENAYIGFKDILCINSKCKYYDFKQLQIYFTEKQKEPEETEIEAVIYGLRVSLDPTTGISYYVCNDGAGSHVVNF